MKATIDGVLLEGTAQEIAEYKRLMEIKIECAEVPIVKDDKRRHKPDGKRYINGRGRAVEVQIWTPNDKMLYFDSLRKGVDFIKEDAGFEVNYNEICHGLIEQNPFFYKGYKINKIKN